MSARRRGVTAESQQVTDARCQRVERLANAMLNWQVLAEQKQYPQSLHDICEAALVHEYRLGRQARR